MKWIECSDRLPPKDRPFLAKTTTLVEMMQWKQRVINGIDKGWYAFYCPCSCCNGHCSDQFSFWTYLPEPPKE